VREKIAALLPLPAFLKRRLAGHGADDHGSTASIGGQAATLAQLSTAAASYADPVMHWGKAVAKAAAVAAAVVGAGVASHEAGLIGGGGIRDERPAAIEHQVAPAGGDSAATLSTRPASNGTTNGASSTPSKGSGAGGSSGSGSSSGSAGSQSPSSPAGDDPVKAATGTRLPSTDDNPVTKTARKLTDPDTRGLPVKTPTLPSTQVPEVEIPKVEVPQVQVPSGVPDPGGVVTGAAGAVNGATGTATGAVNGATGTVTGAVNGATGTVTGTVNGTVGGVTGGGGILGGG
jgi:hypothetical protein